MLDNLEIIYQLAKSQDIQCLPQDIETAQSPLRENVSIIDLIQLQQSTVCP